MRLKESISILGDIVEFMKRYKDATVDAIQTRFNMKNKRGTTLTCGEVTNLLNMGVSVGILQIKQAYTLKDNVRFVINDKPMHWGSSRRAVSRTRKMKRGGKARSKKEGSTLKDSEETNDPNSPPSVIELKRRINKYLMKKRSVDDVNHETHHPKSTSSDPHLIFQTPRPSNTNNKVSEPRVVNLAPRFLAKVAKSRTNVIPNLQSGEIGSGKSSDAQQEKKAVECSKALDHTVQDKKKSPDKSKMLREKKNSSENYEFYIT